LRNGTGCWSRNGIRMENETKKEGRAAVPQHIAEASDAKKRAKRKTLARFEERCYGFRSLLEREEVNILDLQRIECVINSYMGFCKGRRTYGRRKQFINSMGGAFWKYFTVGGHYQNIKIKSRYRYKTIAL